MLIGFNQFKIFNVKCHKMPNCNQQGGAAVLFMLFGVHGRKGFGPAALKDSLVEKIVIVWLWIYIVKGL